jgi:hypothetical protein
MQATHLKPPSEAAFQCNLHGIKFLQTEIDLANVFLDFGETSNERAHQEQSRCGPEAAYRSALHFLPRLLLTAEESADFNHRIALLRTRLLAAGITP